MDLTISIVTWNLKEKLKDCLESIFSQLMKIDYEVYVVDNGSTDETSYIVRNFFPKVCLITNKENLGFVRAHNQVLKISNAKYFLFLNDDTIILDNALEKMVGFMELRQNVGACGLKLVDKNGYLQSNCCAKFPSVWSVFNEYFFSRYLNYYSTENYKNNFEVDSISGACLLVRKEILNKIGYLEKEFFSYSEDVDLCLRIKNAGWKNMYLSFAKVIHLGANECGRRTKKIDDFLIKSKITYFKIHYGIFISVLIWLIIYTSFFLRKPVKFLSLKLYHLFKKQYV